MNEPHFHLRFFAQTRLTNDPLLIRTITHKGKWIVGNKLERKIFRGKRSESPITNPKADLLRRRYMWNRKTIVYYELHPQS